MTRTALHRLPILLLPVAAACVGPPEPGTGGPPPCEVAPGNIAEQAIYVPPLAIQLEVPAGDGGVLVCTPGISDECQRLLDEDCRATLDGVSVGSSEDFEIGVRNLSTSETLTIQDVSLSSSTDPALSIAGAPPPEIEPDTSEVITVRFSPGIPGEVTGRLRIESDAVNAGDEGTEIEIRATAVE